MAYIPERDAELKARRWLESRGFTVQKGANVDMEARKSGRLWQIEVKGDQTNKSGRKKGQANNGALRNSFMVALSQSFVAIRRHPRSKVSLGLTRQYADYVDKYSDVLSKAKISIVWISSRKVWEQGSPKSPNRRSQSSARQNSSGKSHKNGIFECGPARFKVANGKLDWVKWDGKRREFKSYKALCDALNITVGGDSANRALYRHSKRA